MRHCSLIFFANSFRRLILSTFVLLFGLAPCYADDRIAKDDLEFFEKQVRPLLVQKCYECHAGDESSGGLLLDSRPALLRGGDSGSAVQGTEPNKSLLVNAIRYTDEDLQMPPSGRMTDQQIDVIEDWIKRGLPDPRGESRNASAANGPTGMSIEDGKQFWSFQPVAEPMLPVGDDKSWIRTPVDAFILNQLEQNGIAPPESTDRQTLIRRVTFDLIGLPPTPSQVEAFVSDDSPDAYANLVERLLASPQYGVRWGRHWLDVARYADSNGLDENLAFGTAWKYRDYVVNAFNDDKPFDRFLIEQIAGDLLPAANRETKTATGFLVLGAKVLAEPDREKLQMDTIDEQLDATGKAFLGMTFGCVRCHDHKFDPIKQADYYSLAAIFKSTKTFGDTNTGAIKHWHENSFDTDTQKAILKQVDAQIAGKKKAASTYKNKVIGAIRSEARRRAVDYLVAATQFDPSASLNTVAKIAKPLGLHPRILHHCRRHLQFHTDGNVFGPWHKLANGQDAIRDHYEKQFTAVDEALDAARKVDPKANKIADKVLEQYRVARDDNSGFLAVPPKVEYAFNAEQLSHYNALMEDARLVESAAMDADTAMGVADDTIHDDLPIHIRGSHRNFGESVPREFPVVMRTSEVRPIFPSRQSGRLELARWMASTQHPLTARVFVNRIWRWHFGRGIVASTENFGVLGDRPTHPDLLDWLAVAFIKSGWSTKAMHRIIVLSSTYRARSARHSKNAIQCDPENELLWKFPIQRLDAEQIRDAVLATSGRLDDTLGGKTVPLRNRQFVFNHTSVDHTKYDSLRRAIYLPVIRNNLYALFAQFDFPDPTMPTGSRASTVVAPQALWMMNSPLVMDSANEMAKMLIDHARDSKQRIDLAYRIALGRIPVTSETDRALKFVDQITSRNLTGSHQVDPRVEQHAWALFCQSLYASNEFIYVR